jgi:hypothetical protein
LSPASASSVVSGRIDSSRQAVDGHELLGEAAVLGGLRRAPVGLQREAVELGARQLPAGGDELGADALRHQAVGVAGGDAGAERVGAGRDVGPHRHAAHRLHAAGDDRVVGAGHDALGGEVHGLLGAAALAVDGRGRDRLGQPGGEHRVARGVHRLLGDLVDAAADDVVEALGVDARALDERAQRPGEQVDGVDGVQRALAGLAPADRGADGVDDHGFAHGVRSSPMI